MKTMVIVNTILTFNYDSVGGTLQKWGRDWWMKMCNHTVFLWSRGPYWICMNFHKSFLMCSFFPGQYILLSTLVLGFQAFWDLFAYRLLDWSSAPLALDDLCEHKFSTCCRRWLQSDASTELFSYTSEWGLVLGCFHVNKVSRLGKKIIFHTLLCFL